MRSRWSSGRRAAASNAPRGNRGRPRRPSRSVGSRTRWRRGRRGAPPRRGAPRAPSRPRRRGRVRLPRRLRGRRRERSQQQKQVNRDADHRRMPTPHASPTDPLHQERLPGDRPPARIGRLLANRPDPSSSPALTSGGPARSAARRPGILLLPLAGPCRGDSVGDSTRVPPRSSRAARGDPAP